MCCKAGQERWLLNALMINYWLVVSLLACQLIGLSAYRLVSLSAVSLSTCQLTGLLVT
jgi:hypothetical protein